MESWVQPDYDNFTGKAGISYDNVFFKGYFLLVLLSTKWNLPENL
jgi:hypothetical protein